jgi:hypothetical protein
MTNEALKQKLEKIKALADECLVAMGEIGGRGSTEGQFAHVAMKKLASAGDIALAVANKAKDCEETDVFQKILDKRDREGKVLLCFFVAHKYFDNERLTTGQITVITSELGSKIDPSNVNKSIKALGTFLESNSVRKQGQVVRYRLNRRGLARFTQLLQGATT